MPDTNHTEKPESKDSIVSKCLATAPADWSPNLMAVFANRLEHALFEERKGKLVAVGEQLDALMHHVFASAPAGVREAIIQDKGDPAIRLAFLLGNLSFAHHFACSTAHRRPDDDFYAALDDASSKQLFVNLAAAPKTAPELAAALEQPVEDVTGKLRQLTGLGIVEFRRRFGPEESAGAVEYFLTPAAQQLTANPH